MAEQVGPGLIVRVVTGVIGIAALAGAALVRADQEALAVTLALAGVGSLLLAVHAPWISKAKVAGVLEVEYRERDAAAKVADRAVGVEELEREIASADEVRPAPSPQDADVIGALNYTAGNMALQAIFDWTTAEGEPLDGCQLRLYLFDEDEDLLLPVLAPPDAANATAWKVGQGATGAAYASGDYVIATGAAVSDGTYGLTADQQERFRRLAAVAAAPVYNAGGRVIGVVTASTSTLDHRLDTEEGRRDHTLAALLVSRVLVELMQWFDDEA